MCSYLVYSFPFNFTKPRYQGSINRDPILLHFIPFISNRYSVRCFYCVISSGCELRIPYNWAKATCVHNIIVQSFWGTTTTNCWIKSTNGFCKELLSLLAYPQALIIQTLTTRSFTFFANFECTLRLSWDNSLFIVWIRFHFKIAAELLWQVGDVEKRSLCH